MKQEKLIKLLQLTQSKNDNECLAAIRKANKMLSAAKHDWNSYFESLRPRLNPVTIPFPAPTSGAYVTHFTFFTNAGRQGSFTVAGSGGDKKP